VFKGALREKTRILVTHAIDFVHLADKVVVMKEGEIKVQGTYEEVLDNPIVQEILEIHNKNRKEKEAAFKEDEKDESTGDTSDKSSDKKEPIDMILTRNSTLSNLTP